MEKQLHVLTEYMDKNEKAKKKTQRKNGISNRSCRNLQAINEQVIGKI